MDFLSVKPGLLFWSIIIFLAFLVVLYFIGAKSFIKNIINRENFIKQSLDTAEKNKLATEQIRKEIEQKMAEAQKVIDETFKKAKEDAVSQATTIIDTAKKERERILNEATSEIERSKQNAIYQIRSEIADLVVSSTEKIIGEKLNTESDKKIIDLYINQLPKN
jgi:F-type H+-transporting ATPase subunit b